MITLFPFIIYLPKDIIDNKDAFLLKYKYYCNRIKVYPEFIQKYIVKDNFSYKYLVFLKQQYADADIQSFILIPISEIIFFRTSFV